MKKYLNIRNAKHLINEFRYPRTEKYKDTVEFVISSNSKLFNALLERKNLNDDTSLLDGIPAGINKIIKPCKLTTKMLSKRFLVGTNDPDIELSSLSQQTIIYGSHPKENECHWTLYHDVLLSNAKLFDMKLIESPLCPLYNISQDTYHILFDCKNSKTVWTVISEDFETTFAENDFKYGNSDFKTNNILLCAKRLLVLYKNKVLDKTFIRKAISNRLKDIDCLLSKKDNDKLYKAGKKRILNSVCIT